ncbi:MAG: VWA domain-containing protein, partial [Bacteroidota bacterium]
DQFDTRYIGDWRRFPILEHRDEILKVGIMGQVTAGLTGFSQADNAEIQRKNAQVRQGRRNINLVFVVDGTYSMQRYFPPISRAIKESMANLKARYTKNKIRFGAVVYRDAAEGKRALESTRLTSDFNQVAQFIEKIDPRDLYDKDKPEALYMGVEAALRGVGLQKNQTNILILVGDAGNHYRDDRTQRDVETLIQQMHDFAVSLVAFQVQHGPDKTYEDFVSQTKHLMLSAARKTYRQQIRQASTLGLRVKPPKFALESEGLERLNQGATMGSLLVAQQGEALPLGRFEQEIERAVRNASAYTDELLDLTDQIVTTGGSAERIITENQPKTDSSNFVSDYTPAVLDYLMDLNISAEKLRLICQENYQFYMEGYTSFMVDGQPNPYFKSVLFMTRTELADMVNAFDELIDAVRAGEQREKMQEVWIELLRSHLGDIDRVELLDMSMEDINDRVFGLPKTSDFLAKIKLKHISDKAVLPPEEFQTYVVRIRDKRDELKRIFNGTYPYSFQSNDKTYYWIDEDALP